MTGRTSADYVFECARSRAVAWFGCALLKWLHCSPAVRWKKCLWNFTSSCRLNIIKLMPQGRCICPRFRVTGIVHVNYFLIGKLFTLSRTSVPRSNISIPEALEHRWILQWTRYSKLECEPEFFQYYMRYYLQIRKLLEVVHGVSQFQTCCCMQVILVIHLQIAFHRYQHSTVGRWYWTCS